MEEKKGSDHLSYADAAVFTGLPRGTLYCLVSKKQIPHIRISTRLVRFSREGLHKWMASMAVEATNTKEIGR